MRNGHSRRDFLLGSTGLAALAIGGCAGRAPATGQFDWTLRSPADVGMRSDGPELMRAAMQASVDAFEAPGLVAAVARGKELAFFETAGLRNVETGQPMQKDDLFRMMSSTKPVTAVAVLILQDEGKLAIDDPVSMYLPSFRNQKVATLPPELLPSIADPAKWPELKEKVQLVPAEREVTIKHLLTHTSGLSSGYGIMPGPASLFGGLPLQPTDTLADRIPKLGALALDFQPGSRFGYSALDGFDVLLHIVELVSGQPADVFLRDRLFEPLDMVDTGFVVPQEKLPRLLRPYSRKSGRWEVAGPMFAGNQETTYFSGAGGLISSVRDFMHFELMLLQRGSFRGRRILKPETVQQMATNQVGSLFADWIPPITKGVGFGLGVRIVMEASASSGTRSVGSFGWGGAYGTESWVDPLRDLAIVNFMQCADGRAPSNPEFFAKAVMQAFPVA